MSVARARPTRRWTADEVMRLVELGVLHEDERVELIDGELVAMSPKSAGHEYTTDALREALSQAYGDRAWVRQEATLRSDPHSLPEPDLAVARGSRADYRRSAPTGLDVLLVVEVSVSTLDDDRAKAALYARAGVPEYWIVDVDGRRIEIHREPLAEGRYRLVEILGEDAVLVPPGTASRIALGDVLA